MSHTPPVDSKGAAIDELREKLADIEHQRWADWQKWCHKILRANIKHDIEPTLARWEKQIATPYSELTRQEQLSDLEQVDRYWPLIESFLAQEVNRIIGEDEPDDGFTDDETVIEDGLVKVFRQVRNDLRAEQRRKAGLV